MEAASDKQAEKIVLLDTRQICSFADYFIISISRHIEGTPDSGWVLLDVGDVIVHIFSSRQREYYQMDTLWSNAIPVVTIQ
jgi:ribosome-associated protein